MDWARPIVAFLVSAVVTAVLSALAAKPGKEKAGWRHIVPSPMHWAGLILGGGLVLLMGWVRLFVGSSRADNGQQMTILGWLIAAFALGTVAVAVSIIGIRRTSVRTRGTQLVWRAGGLDQAANLDDLREIKGDWLGAIVFKFADGRRLRVDPHARGAAQLIEAAAAIAPDRP